MDLKFFRKDWTMKTVSLLSVLVVAVCLIGCENAELITCQQEKDTLQGQIELANTVIAEKDTQIEALKTENIEIQNTAMESISTMMAKQAKKDKELKQKLVGSDQQVKDLEAKVATLEKQIAGHKCPVPKADETKMAEDTVE